MSGDGIWKPRVTFYPRQAGVFSVLCAADKNMVSRSSRRAKGRPKNDTLKLIGTALLVVAVLMALAFWNAAHRIDQLGQKRALSALLYSFVGVYALYVALKHRRYVSQLPDSAGNRKIKRQQAILFITSFLFLLGAAWKLWLLASSK